jgi:hypothetical protein
VVIPTKTLSNVAACIKAARDAGESSRVIVIDDFDSAVKRGKFFDKFVYANRSASDALYLVPGLRPFIFSRNCNIGIRASDEGDDLILCNDDALLQTPGGFTAMQRVARENPAFGIISATTNLAGNPDQQPQGIGLRDAGSKSVAFVCVLIPRRTLDTVGLLDERFTAYGWEDNDYCRRVRDAGLKVGIFDGCYVDHGSLTSTFRGAPGAAGNISAGAEIYRAKWGDLA